MINVAAIVVTAALGFGLYQLASVPMINDVSTNTAEPPSYPLISALPENHGRSYEMAADALQSSIETKAEELSLVGSWAPSAVGLQVRQLIEVKGWRLITTDPQALVIEAVAQTALLRFQDDFVVRITPSEVGREVRIDFRSRSRIGKSDLGANHQRITEFRKELLERL